jgi:hypothetical protein
MGPYLGSLFFFSYVLWVQQSTQLLLFSHMMHIQDLLETKIETVDSFKFVQNLAQKQSFFFVQSIIHGVYIVPDFEEQGDFFVDDLIDEDMFLRMEMLHT